MLLQEHVVGHSVASVLNGWRRCLVQEFGWQTQEHLRLISLGK